MFDTMSGEVRLCILTRKVKKSSISQTYKNIKTPQKASFDKLSNTP